MLKCLAVIKNENHHSVFNCPEEMIFSDLYDVTELAFLLFPIYFYQQVPDGSH